MRKQKLRESNQLAQALVIKKQSHTVNSKLLDGIGIWVKQSDSRTQVLCHQARLSSFATASLSHQGFWGHQGGGGGQGVGGEGRGLTAMMRSYKEFSTAEIGILPTLKGQ